MKIPIVEMFPAIQGEGKEAGVNTYFIRVAGCNMEPKCSFCDTKYSWDMPVVTPMKIEDLFQKMLLNTQNKSGKRHFTFTGGEPVLYDDQIMWLRDRLPNPTKFSVETNGLRKTIVPYDTISCSPKKQNINLEVLRAYAKMPNTILKFVFEAESDRWFEKVIEESGFPTDRVYLMPEGKIRQEQLNRMGTVIDYCVRKGYNFSPRLHVLAFNDRRGV